MGRLLARACLILLAPVECWFAVNLVHPTGPDFLLWASMPGYGVLVTVIFWRTSRSASMPAGTRRFWRHLTPMPLLVGAGQTAQALDVLAHPGVPGAHLTGPMLALDGTSLLVLIHALGRLPLGAQDRGTATRIVLDAGTVALATAAFIWHFNTRTQIGPDATAGDLASLVLIVLAMLGVFALTKVLLAEYSPINGRGLRLLAAAIFVGALAPLLQPILPADGARLYTAQAHIPLVFTLAAWSAVRQTETTAGPRGRARRRPYSVLPYAAVAAVDVLLLWVAARDHEDLLMVAVAAVALTALVATRQLTALRDNARLVDRLDHLASHDALTGLANRSLFQHRLRAALAAPADRPVGVALLDLDDFKQINDTLGHEAGDQLLVAVAGRLAACVGPGDTVARLGGDEFVVVLDGADPAIAAETAGRMVGALRESVTVGGRDLPVRASIGLAGGHGGAEAGELLRRADMAMYAAKKIPGTAYVQYAEPLVPVAALMAEDVRT